MLAHTVCLELPRSQIQQCSIGTLSDFGGLIRAHMTSPCSVWEKCSQERIREGVHLGFVFWPRGKPGNVPSPPL